MSTLRGWVGRHRFAAGFAAGALLTLLAVAVVGYLVLADQHRSARVLAAALSQALARDVHIDRVTEMNPSRVVMKGVRLSKDRGWPADIVAESVEASGPLLAAARGAAAPIRVQVTRPTISAGGEAAGLVALEGLRQGLADFLANPAVVDVGVTGGVLEAPAPASEAVTFDATLRKGPGSVHGEVLLRDRGQARFGLGLDARPEGDTVRVALSGEGQLAPLAPWLPPAVVRGVGSAPVDLRAQVGLESGDRLAGRVSTRLGDLATLEGAVSLREGVLGLTELRGAADLGFVASAAGRTDPVRGRAELTDGEVSWSPERGGWPSARADLRVVEATLPPAVAGSEVRVQGLETRLTLEPREAHAVLRGELHGDRVGAAGIELAPLSTSWLVDLDAGGAVTRAELSGLTAQVLGVPVRGTVTHHALRARTDARLEMAAARLDPLLRQLGADWLGPSDQLRAGSLRLVATDLDPSGWTEGKVEADIRGLALKQPDGETRVDRARVGATVQGGSAAITLEAVEVQGAAPHLQGVLPRVDGSADVGRADVGAGLKRASLVARDAQGRELVLADLSRLAPGITRSGALDRASPGARAPRFPLADDPEEGDRIGGRRASVARRGVRDLRGTPRPEDSERRAPGRKREPARRLGRRADPAGRTRAGRRPLAGRADHGGRAHRVRRRALRRLGAGAGRRLRARHRRPPLPAVLRSRARGRWTSSSATMGCRQRRTSRGRVCGSKSSSRRTGSAAVR